MERRKCGTIGGRAGRVAPEVAALYPGDALEAWVRVSSKQASQVTGMNDSQDKPPPAVGVYWINEEDYPALLKIFADGHTMPRTWNEWRKMAEEMESGLKAYGHVVMRVRIDPSTFPDWCAAHGMSTGREGRKKFVAAAVTERYGDQN
jgi:hypothetical protein